MSVEDEDRGDEQQLEDQGFDDAFDEDESSAAAAVTDTEVDDEPDNSGDGDQAGDADGGVENQHDDQGDDDSGEQGEDASGSDDDSSDKPLTEQQLRSWEGRLRKREQELEDMRQDNGDDDDDDDGADDGDDDQQQHTEDDILNDPEFQQFADDYPDLAPVVAKMAGKIVDSRMGKAVDPIRSDLSERDVRQHFREIKREHPDFDDIVNSGELKDWIESLPYKDGQRYMGIYERGLTDDVIDMVSDFKKATKQDDQQRQDNSDSGSEGAKSKDDSMQQQRRSGGQAVDNHSSRPSRGAGKKDPNDFDGAWDEEKD